MSKQNPDEQQNAPSETVSLVVTGYSPSGTLSYSASVLPEGLSINSSIGLASGVLGMTPANPNALAPAATGSMGSLTYSSSGLPAGLSINSSTGLITGTI